MSTALAVLKPAGVTSPEVAAPVRVLQLPWRDPSAVSKKELAGYIGSLEKACLENPGSADLRTCLGMAYAMNYDVYKSMDALELAVNLDATHFWAQMKLAELFYRLRALPKAEEETIKAINLAQNGRELSFAKKQLLEIRRLIREGTQKPEWNRPLKTPALVLMAMTVILCVIRVVWK